VIALGTQYEYIDAQLGATETTYTDLGDITVPDGASRITGICMEEAAELGYATEGQLGIGKLEFQGSAQLEGIPVAYVQSTATGQVFYRPAFIPVNIAVDEKTVIAVGMKLTLAQTGQTHHGKCCLRFE
jgi:hypothetical protein